MAIAIGVGVCSRHHSLGLQRLEWPGGGHFPRYHTLKVVIDIHDANYQHPVGTVDCELEYPAVHAPLYAHGSILPLHNLHP